MAPSVVTEYAGTYTPISGQATTLPETYPARIVCSGEVTSYTFLWPIVTSGMSTRTSTPLKTVNSYTATTTTTITYGTATIWAVSIEVPQTRGPLSSPSNFPTSLPKGPDTLQTTVTSTATTYKVAYTVAPTSTACEETYTTTYAAKCAPTNLIGAIDGVGLVAGTYAPGVAVTYGPDVPGDQFHSDASLCCQLCLDNEGCGASMAAPAFDAACGLLYVWNSTSGGPEYEDFVFSYQTEAGVVPGESLIVQAGAGLITYEGECCT